MIHYIDFIISNFIFDFSATLIYKRVFNLKVKNFYLALLQIMTICASMIYIFCIKSIVIYLLLKLVFYIIIILFTTENYLINNLLVKFATFEILILIVFGGYVFIGLFYCEIINGLFGVKTAKMFKYFVNIAIFIQYTLIFCVIRYFENVKMKKEFLAQIEFCLLNQHIKITGLIDSGNMLYDEKTGFPVVVISLKILKKYLSVNNYELITILLKQARVLECVCVNEEKFKIPIVDVCDCVVNCIGEKTKQKFVLGVIQKNIDTISKFECLLHRDFI